MIDSILIPCGDSFISVPVSRVLDDYSEEQRHLTFGLFLQGCESIDYNDRDMYEILSFEDDHID